MKTGPIIVRSATRSISTDACSLWHRDIETPKALASSGGRGEGRGEGKGRGGGEKRRGEGKGRPGTSLFPL